MLICARSRLISFPRTALIFWPIYVDHFIATDGVYWYDNGNKIELVKSARTAAVFEIGRLMTENPLT
jgi:hypothetical protein